MTTAQLHSNATNKIDNKEKFPVTKNQMSGLHNPKCNSTQALGSFHDVQGKIANNCKFIIRIRHPIFHINLYFQIK